MATLLQHYEYMTETDTPEITPDDPRFGLAQVVSAVRGLIDGTTADQHDGSTPCSEFTVKDLLNHLNLVMNRVAVIGNGGHWSEVTDESVARDDGHGEAFAEAAHATMNAWTDSAKLEQMYEVPWGDLPGAPVLMTYTAELATHAWDLATATGQKLEIPDEALHGALVAAKMLPGEGREDPEFPFDAVVDPGEDAPLVLQIAGWLGRDVVAG